MIHAVILSGGWGRRFWPKSRKRLPKQLLHIGTKHSPLQNLFNIIKSEIPAERIWVVANKLYARRLRAQLPGLGRRNLLVEPLAKNTAAAVGLASVVIKRADPQAVTVVLSSDHIIGQNRRFLQAIKVACRKALASDALIAIGIHPQRAAEEFGYLKIVRKSQSSSGGLKVHKVEKFVEKPDLKKAKGYLRSKNYLWNSGIFVWKVSSILKMMQRHLPQTYSGLQRIEKTLGQPQYKSRLLKEYSKFRNISIDYGVMEKSRNIYTVMGKFGWQDLGTWAYYSSGFYARDKNGNVIQGLHKGIDTCDSVLIGTNKHFIATIGVHDLIIVHTPHATLVCKKDKAQEVKKLTEMLEQDERLRKYL